jgi:hypothetical protein
MTYLLLDLRVRSTVTVEIEKIPVGVVGDLSDMWKILAVVDDSGKTYLPGDGTEISNSPSIQPDVLTGGTVAYLLPDHAAGLVLRCDFGEYGLPDGRQLRPRPLSFPLDARARFCPQCGEPAGATDKFCGKCGTKL